MFFLNTLSKLTHLSQQQDERLDSTDCYVISGKRLQGAHTYWVSKDDFLIRQYRSVSGGGVKPEESSIRELSDESIARVLKAQNKEATPQEIANFRTRLADARAAASEVIVTRTETYRQIILDQPISEEQCVPSKDIDEIAEELETLRAQYQSRLQNISPTKPD